MIEWQFTAAVYTDTLNSKLLATEGTHAVQICIYEINSWNGDPSLWLVGQEDEGYQHDKGRMKSVLPQHILGEVPFYSMNSPCCLDS